MTLLRSAGCSQPELSELSLSTPTSHGVSAFFHPHDSTSTAGTFHLRFAGAPCERVVSVCTVSLRGHLGAPFRRSSSRRSPSCRYSRQRRLISPTTTVRCTTVVQQTTRTFIFLQVLTDLIKLGDLLGTSSSSFSSSPPVRIPLCALED